jgi:hypothetical protein
MSIRDFKRPEECFLEIANFVANNRNERIDECKNINKSNSTLTYSKTRNVNTTYVYEGTLRVAKDVDLRFYFSHKRSCICLEPQTINEINKLQCYLTQCVESLFKDHKIDVFINGLSREQGY